ncbi:hypothetical protein [Streptomyces sp. NPDC012450]|uniref:hypothetical protein n=1 Tax=Streptomyces sp. NPDC012450 TaxID=3364834 RepID=UPI0036F1884F
MPRLRITLTHWPRRALALVDTPHPDCPDCDGEGFNAYGYGDDEPEWGPCHCWDHTRVRILLPLPSRNSPADYSDEPPF